MDIRYCSIQVGFAQMCAGCGFVTSVPGPLGLRKKTTAWRKLSATQLDVPSPLSLSYQKNTCSFFKQNHSYRVHIGATPHMRLITEAKYATLVDLLAARRPFNVHFCPPRLLSALRFADLRACAAVIYILVMKRLFFVQSQRAWHTCDKTAAGAHLGKANPAIRHRMSKTF